eukprot:612554-Pyramimonas_sp.AAC.1
MAPPPKALAEHRWAPRGAPRGQIEPLAGPASSRRMLMHAPGLSISHKHILSAWVDGIARSVVDSCNRGRFAEDPQAYQISRC